MDDREKLVELLKTNACPSPFMCDPTCRYYGYGDCFPDRFADHLLAHGVTIREPGTWVVNTDDFTPAYRCSVCGYNKPMIAGEGVSQGAMNFCPNCGAPMKGESK